MSAYEFGTKSKCLRPTRNDTWMSETMHLVLSYFFKLKPENICSRHINKITLTKLPTVRS